MSKSKKSLKPYQKKGNEIILDFRTATLDLWEMLYFGFPILPLVTILLYKIPYPIYFGLYFAFTMFVIGLAVILWLSQKNKLTKFVRIKGRDIEFQYYWSVFNETIRLRHKELIINVYSSEKNIRINLLGHIIIFKQPTDLPIFLEHLEQYAPIKFDKSVEVRQGNEMLKYQILK